MLPWEDYYIKNMYMYIITRWLIWFNLLYWYTFSYLQCKEESIANWCSKKVIIYWVRLNTGNVILHVHIQVLYNTWQHRHCWKVFVFIFNDKSLKYLSGIYCFLWRPKVIWMRDFVIRRLFLWRHNVVKTLTSQSQNESIKVDIFSCFKY